MESFCRTTIDCVWLETHADDLFQDKNVRTSFQQESSFGGGRYFFQASHLQHLSLLCKDTNSIVGTFQMGVIPGEGSDGTGR